MFYLFIMFYQYWWIKDEYINTGQPLIEANSHWIVPTGSVYLHPRCHDNDRQQLLRADASNIQWLMRLVVCRCWQLFINNVPDNCARLLSVRPSVLHRRPQTSQLIVVAHAHLTPLTYNYTFDWLAWRYQRNSLLDNILVKPHARISDLRTAIP